MQPGHVDLQVGGLEQVLHLPRVWVEPGAVDVDVRRQHPVDDRSEGGRGHPRVPLLADGLVEVPGCPDVDPGEGPGAVGGEVPVDLPSLPPVVGLLHVHGGRPEGLKGDDDMGDVELSLQVQLDGHVLQVVLSLIIETRSIAI